MKIRVRGFMTVRQLLGGRDSLTLELQEATIVTLLGELASLFGASFEEMFFEPEYGTVSRQVAILVNGRHYSHLPNGLNTKLKDGDDVALFPPIAGG
ncbi:MAG: MoaD family protein [Chloroflexota bacterium]|jgi:MoaD family protein